VKHWRFLAASALILPLLVLAAVPNVAVRDIVGNPRNVNEFIGKGKWVVVAVWSADCPICKREIYHMTFFHDEHHNKNAEVLGLSVDGYPNKEKVRRFIEDHALNFQNLIGTPDDASLLAGTLFIGTPS
jgi:peroxiredoxin